MSRDLISCVSLDSCSVGSKPGCFSAERSTAERRFPKVIHKKKKKKIISTCLAGPIVLQRMRMEFILFNLPSRDSSQIDLLAETAQADFSCSSQADYIREGELELQSGEVSSPARAQPQGAPAGPVVWDQCLKPCQGWDEPDMGSALLQHSTGGQ